MLVPKAFMSLYQRARVAEFKQQIKGLGLHSCHEPDLRLEITLVSGQCGALVLSLQSKEKRTEAQSDGSALRGGESIDMTYLANGVESYHPSTN